MSSGQSLYGPQQSRFARYLERREAEHPDQVHRELRRRLLANAAGEVLEVGCGDGRSFEHYPPGVARVFAVEPDAVARAAAAERAHAAAVPIEVVEGSAELLPAPDGAFDAVAVLSVLCSVPQPAAALGEVRRVLKPGGRLLFFEHVASERLLFRQLQRLVDRLFWTRALGGCRTTRDTVATIRRAEFEIEALERGFHSSSPLTVTSAPYVLGVARAPG
jgi:ubiquinone/menaquinone biosynthesis C-methylase UbiE